MAVLNTLNIAADIDYSKVDPVMTARVRLIASLGEQLKAAEAMVNGTEYRVKRHRWETVEATGEKVRKEIEVPLRKWYWRDVEGKVRFAVKAGNKRIEFKPGMTNVIVGDDKELPKVIGTVIKAVEQGELDKQLAKIISEKKPNKKTEAKK